MVGSHLASIKGLGMYVPKKILTNHDLSKIIDTTDEWIKTRTGISERHIAEEGQCSSDLGAEASREALKDAGILATDLDLIITATITPDMLFPSTACGIQAKIGAKCGAFDMAAACSGFPYALSIAESFIKSGIYKNILVVAAEVLSKFMNWKDRSTCVLFGDGSGAAVVSRGCDESHNIIGSYLGADGNEPDILKIPAGGSLLPPSIETVKENLHSLHMRGADVFKIAVKTMEEAVKKIIQKSNLTTKDIDCLIPHQANNRILCAVADRLNIPHEKVLMNVDRYGNMSGASTAVALYEASKQKKIKKSNYVVLVAFGGGLTWATNLIRW